MLSLLMLCMGVALLIAATTVGVASSGTQKASSSKALRGGTLRPGVGLASLLALGFLVEPPDAIGLSSYHFS